MKMKMPKNTMMLALSFSLCTISTAGLGVLLANEPSESKPAETEYIIIERPVVVNLCAKDLSPGHWKAADGQAFVKNGAGVVLRIYKEIYRKESVVFELHNIPFKERKVVDFYLATDKMKGSLSGSTTVYPSKEETTTVQLGSVHIKDTFLTENLKHDNKLQISIDGQEHVFDMKGSLRAINMIL